jgi:5-methylcytosine-specific restriction endonuclease McrA
MNRWGIPAWLEEEVRERDRFCVYCGVAMVDSVPSGESRRNVASWEHIINDASIVNRQNIALCCTACNASKGAKDLAEWMESEYCRRHGITPESVTDVIKAALRGAAV